MATDIFLRADAHELLKNKSILFFGDSNTRALYKDLIWLLNEGSLIWEEALRRKNELSHAGDTRVSNGRLVNSRNYEENREYVNEKFFVRFQFITKLYHEKFVEYLDGLRYTPSAIILNSCLWDLTRWGPNGVEQFKSDLDKTFTYLRKRFGPKLHITWLTTLPPSPVATKNGLLTPEIEFMRNLLPFHIIEANSFASDLARKYEINVLDTHYQMRLMGYDRNYDGIHWGRKSVRYLTNCLLTHLAICFGEKLPENEFIFEEFLNETELVRVAEGKKNYKKTVMSAIKKQGTKIWKKIKAAKRRNFVQKKRSDYYFHRF